MNSKALIQETLKYLETDANNKPKYRFEIYTSGMEKYYRESLSSVTFGLIPNNSTDDEDEPKPVTVYTISDVFDTLKDTGEDIANTIQALPDTLENIKVSLKQLGFQALDQTIEYIKAATIPIEVLQTVDQIYRVAKPLVQKIVNIASIRFHFENAALVAQDVLQYLTRFATQTAKNALNRLWEIFLDTPIFAIYENDDTVDLAEVYSGLSDAARDAIDSIARNSKAFGDILTYINGSDKTVYEPKYNNFGIAIPDDIVDVYSEPHTRKIYIASEHYIYSLNENYTTKEILHTTSDKIKRIYFYADSIYYITGNESYSYIKKNQDTIIKTIAGNVNNFDIIFSEPILLTNGTKIYTGAGTEITDILMARQVDEPIDADLEKYYEFVNGEYVHTEDEHVDSRKTYYYAYETLTHHCYDQEKDIIYYTSSVTNNDVVTYGINTITKDAEFNYYKTELSVLDIKPEDISYFNNSLYIVLANSGIYRVYKTAAGFSYGKTEYEYHDYTVNNKNNIIWTDSKYATDGKNIFSVNNNDITYVCQPTSSINCVTKHNYNDIDYFVCSGGNRLYSTMISDNGNGIKSYKWQDKILSTASSENSLNIEIPENIAGCLWFNNGYGDNLIAYSQEHVYTIGPDYIHQVFDVEEPNKPKDLFLKEFVSFEDWYKDDGKNAEPVVEIEYSSATELLDECIITGMRVINEKIYISLFNPKYNPSNQTTTKSGIYPASIIRNSSTNNIDTFVIDYDHPVLALDYNAKIYSFNKYSDGWYYTDGDNFICPSKKTKTELELDITDENSEKLPDGALFLYDNKVIFTSQAVLTPILSETHTKISTIVNYQSNTVLDIASTKNVLMISDGEYVYNIFNKDGYDISPDLFQVCFKKGIYDYRLIQSNNAVFIVNRNVINKVPLYSELVSSDYGCGYYIDTAPNKWFGAAPYYFASNVLNYDKNNTQKDIYLLYFKQNFKVELEKLLRNIPDAFVAYTQSKLVDTLKEKGFEIEGDDGQILDLIINSVASTTANSIGMYVQEKFAEKIGDDETYDAFATDVYNACRLDDTNNMTEDFYRIFEELYNSAIVEAINNMHLARQGLSALLLRYYQNHKAEWAASMTELIDVDTVDPDIYEIPLKADEVVIPKNTYTFTYDNNGGTYNFDYIASPSAHYSNKNIIEGYYYNNKFYYDIEHTELINDIARDSSTGNYYDADGNLICYYDAEHDRYCRYELEDYNLSQDTEINPEKTYYEKTGSDIDTYVPTEDDEENPNKQYFSRSFGPSSDNFVVNGKVYLRKEDDEITYERMPSNLPTLDLGSYYEKLDYSLTTDTSVSANKEYYISTFVEATSNVSDSIQYYKINYVPTTDTQISSDKKYYEAIDLTDYDTEDEYFEYNPDSTEQKYKINYALATDPFDPDQDYYTEISTDVYELVIDADEQGGPYYIISSFSADSSGTYIKKNFTSATTKIYYSMVANPTLNNLAAYYEATYVKIPTPTSLSNIYVLDYIEVDSPNNSDISTYYEKTDDTYVTAENISYNYDPETGNPVSINNDRNYYLQIYTPGVYYVIENPTGSPYENGWYENVYNEVLSGTFENPSAKGYYEKTSKSIGFEEVEYEYYIQTGTGSESYVPCASESIYDPQQNYYIYYNNVYIPAMIIVNGSLQETCYTRVEPETEGEEPTYEEVEASEIISGTIYYTRSGSGTEEDPYVYTEVYVSEFNPQETTYYIEAEEDPYVYINVKDYTPPQGTIYYIRSGSGTEEDPYVYTEETEWEPFVSHYSRSGSGTEEDPYVYTEETELYFIKSGEDYLNINSVSPVQKGWYELITSYSTIFKDNKLYIDLEPETVTSDFPAEDKKWHDDFYDDVEDAKEVIENLPDGTPIEQIKEAALEELNSILTKPMPSWLWQYLITKSVSEYYIPTQGEQYRQIILDSNMYPIQWDELPDDIDHDSFDYALTALLYAIKQRLITNVTLLVDGGKVKCYSCVDAATVIQKMVNRNAMIWGNQIITAKAKVTKASTKDEVLKAFDMMFMPESSLFMLEKILNKQSALYAKYIDMIIEEQVINDNVTEVSL